MLAFKKQNSHILLGFFCLRWFDIHIPFIWFAKIPYFRNTRQVVTIYGRHTCTSIWIRISCLFQIKVHLFLNKLNICTLVQSIIEIYPSSELVTTNFLLYTRDHIIHQILVCCTLYVNTSLICSVYMSQLVR